VLANALVTDYDWKAAETEYRRALELNPGSALAHHYYSFLFLSPMGRHTEAIFEMQRARELDPMSPTINATLGGVFLIARQYDQAIQQELRSLEIEPHSGFAHLYLAWAYQEKGMFEKALTEMQDLVGNSGNGGMEVSPQELSQLARAYALVGRRADAMRIVAKLDQLSRRAYVSSYDRATIYVALGEKERALEELQHAYEEHSERLIWLSVDWRFDDLHSDPRFQDLLRRLNFPQQVPSLS